MVPLRFLLAAPLLVALLLSCLAPTAAAAPCSVSEDKAPTGGVTGMTYTYARDVANRAAAESCSPSGQTFAEDLANLTCQYLVGLDCV